MLTAPRTVAPFRNAPIRDFSDPADRRSLEAALARVRPTLGRRWPLVIDGLLERLRFMCLHQRVTLPQDGAVRLSRH